MHGAAAAIVKSGADKAGPVTIRHACETKYPADAASGVRFFARRRRQTAGKIARRCRTVDQKPTSGRDPRYNPSTRPPGQALRFAVMAFEVFLSYAHEDKPVADAACAIIEKAGIRCWIAPRDIAPGADYATALMEALDDCKALVLIFSRRANESPHIRREVERAVSRGIPLIPVRVENIEPNAALKYFVGTVHWLDALTPPLEQHFASLATTLGVILKQPNQDAARQVIAPAPPPDDRKMRSRLFRTQAAGIGCFVCGGINLVLLVALRDTIDLLLAIVGAGVFYVLVFRNLTRDLAMARTIMIVLTAILSVSWLSVITQGLWLFVATTSINLLLSLWMIYEINAMIGERKL